MKTSPYGLWLLLSLALSSCRGDPGGRSADLAAASHGLIVERVTPGGAAALAGVEVGDFLMSWRGQSGGARATGEFRRLFDPHWVEVLHAARGGVELTVLRRGPDGASTILALPITGDTWRISARPPLPEPAESAYRAALGGVDAGDPQSGREAAEALLELGRELPQPELQVAVALHAGRLLREQTPGEYPSGAYDDALAVAEASGDAALLAWACQQAGREMQQARRLADALNHHERALEIYVQIQPGSLLEAHARHESALLRAQLGELEPAIAAMDDVLVVRRRLAPDSLIVAAVLNNLGNYVSDLGEQERYHEEALALRERLAPGSLDTASSLNNLGNVAWARGDLRRAEALLERARALLEQIDAPPRFRGGVIGNLALVARERGDLALAELRALEALRIFEQHEPRGPFHAETLNSIGLIRRQRADLDGAASSFRAALEVARGIAETSPRTVNALLNLGSTLADLERHDEAERVLREGAALQERLDPDGATMALVWTALANVARIRGDVAEEERLLRASLARWEDQAPESLLVARALDHLGMLLVRRQALAPGGELLERALALASDLAPGTLDEARLAHHLARTRRLERRPEQALALYARAVAALESQVGTLGGGDDTRTQFRGANRELYREYVELLLEQGLVDQAFSALERSRAQAFVAMLAERDLVFGRELSEALAARRARLEREYDRTLERLAAPSARDSPGEAAASRARLAELRREHESLVTELRSAFPALASLRYPQAPTTEEVSRSLRPGTLLLEFRVGEDSSGLFALASDGALTVHRLDVGERELEALVGRFLLLLRAGPAVAVAAGDDAVGELARELYSRLIAPAAARLETARRLVIVPDGPLHALPFAALVEPGGGELLVERFSYIVAPSAAALSGLRERARDPRRGDGSDSDAVAFGDPAPSALPPLPWARAEVRSIERALGGGVRALFGADATEESVEALAGRVPYLHFAVHGLLDERVPLDSSLVLAAGPGSGRNGLLQAWEVLERVRVDTDLAVLSGCETALGEERAGEGLVGLVRAFHFAGARAVIASLWRVSDRGTAVLMARLYHHLEAGAPPSEALRAAQLELLRAAPEVRDALADLEPRSLRQRVAAWRGRAAVDVDAGAAERLRHPAAWAAFQVHGADG